MKNAHERFGKLMYRRQTEKTSTNLRVFLDAFVGEDGGKAHLVSVVGGDVEIGALAAAFANGDSFTVESPYGAESIVSLGEKPLCFRGSIVVPGRKRAAAEASCELLSGASGNHLGRETALDQRRQFVHLVVAGESLWPSRHPGMGLVDDFAIATAETHTDSFRVWIHRCGGQSYTKATAGAARKRFEKSATPLPRPERPSRMARNPAR
jgi:hypothetical protein